MCGIYGGHPDLLANNCQARLAHRGPDQHGQVMRSDALGRAVVMGQTRLSIVDRHEVDVPMQSGSGDAAVTLSYNGEVYNWREIKQILEGLGHRFETSTDTEVVLAAYREWGMDCLHRFSGMFAIAIYDRGRLLLARDRLGIKPLYYTTNAEGQFAFASEIKCFAQRIFSPVPFCEQLEFYFDQHTAYEGIESILPGQVLEIDLANGQIKKKMWWRLPDFDPVIEDPAEGIRTFLDAFTRACELRKLADVPVTTFLSGGLDSSLIQAVVGSEKTYTVHFNEYDGIIDERPYVREFAERQGFDAAIVIPTRGDLVEHLDAIARAIEMPVGSFSLLPLFMLAKAARQDGFEVGLSGEGADELFNGYHRTGMLLREQAFIDAESAGDYAPLAKRYFGGGLERFCKMASRGGEAGAQQLRKALRPRWHEDNTLAQNITRIETEVFLQPLLTMADRMSMAHGLEMRNPFLDVHVVELATRLSDNLKFRDGQTKWLLRQALRELVGDDLMIVSRKVKHGLPAPVNAWLFDDKTLDRSRWNNLLQQRCLATMSDTTDACEAASCPSIRNA